MKKKVVVSVIGDLSVDQRVQKVCSSLKKVGYEPFVFHTNHRRMPRTALPFKNKRIYLHFQKNFLIYVEFNLKLFFFLLFHSKKNSILLANDLDSLLPNVLISKLFGLKLVYDSHEIFTELPSLSDKTYRKRFWKFLERNLIPHVHGFYTVSQPYCDWFEENYGIKPVLIQNLPLKNGEALPSVPEKLSKELEELKDKKLIIYQGALNPGRGLDKAIEAMQWVKNAELWIFGDGPFRQTLKEQIQILNLGNKVKIKGMLLPKHLKSITQKANLGLSLEEDLGLSYRYAQPNKLFDYIQAHVPILSSYLSGIQCIVKGYKVGKTSNTHDPKVLAEHMNSMLSKGKEAYSEALKTAAEHLVWENQESDLVGVFDEASEHK